MTLKCFDDRGVPLRAIPSRTSAADLPFDVRIDGADDEEFLFAGHVLIYSREAGARGAMSTCDADTPRSGGFSQATHHASRLQLGLELSGNLEHTLVKLDSANTVELARKICTLLEKNRDS